MRTRLIVEIVRTIRHSVTIEVSVLVGTVAVVIVIFAGAVIDMPARRIGAAGVRRDGRKKKNNEA